ncbi:MAG: SIMPL domain-containing protein [Candidatus Eiseniibacteriota bacterium]
MSEDRVRVGVGVGTLVGLIPAAALLALGLMGAAWIAGSYAMGFANARATITVTGSAKKTIRSDLAVWRGMFSAQSPQIQAAYRELEVSQRQVRAYLVRQGFADTSLVFSQIQTLTLYQRSPNGMETGQVDGYRLQQTVEIRSPDVTKIAELSRGSTELIEQGVRFESMPPEFLYTGLANLKVEMLAAATRDARERAEEMAKNSGSKIGRLRSARMGVFQVTPAYSTMVSDYGINDTSSLEKDITSVVSVSFEIR